MSGEAERAGGSSGSVYIPKLPTEIISKQYGYERQTESLAKDENSSSSQAPLVDSSTTQKYYTYATSGDPASSAKTYYEEVKGSVQTHTNAPAVSTPEMQTEASSQQQQQQEVQYQYIPMQGENQMLAAQQQQLELLHQFYNGQYSVLDGLAGTQYAPATQDPTHMPGYPFGPSYMPGGISPYGYVPNRPNNYMQYSPETGVRANQPPWTQTVDMTQWADGGTGEFQNNNHNNNQMEEAGIDASNVVGSNQQLLHGYLPSSFMNQKTYPLYGSISGLVPGDTQYMKSHGGLRQDVGSKMGRDGVRHGAIKEQKKSRCWWCSSVWDTQEDPGTAKRLILSK